MQLRSSSDENDEKPSEFRNDKNCQNNIVFEYIKGTTNKRAKTLSSIPMVPLRLPSYENTE